MKYKIGSIINTQSIIKKHLNRYLIKMKSCWTIELITDFGNHKLDEQNRYFDSLIWENILLFKDDILNIYELKREYHLFRLLKRKTKQRIQVSLLGNFNHLLKNEIDKLKEDILTWDLNYLFQVEKNDLLLEIIKNYNFDFTINKFYVQAYKEQEIDVLLDLIKHLDNNSKIVSFLPEAQGVFILFPSEKTLSEFIDYVDELKKK